MNSFLRAGGFLLLALLAGVAAGHLICSSATLRGLLGCFGGRGDLIALCEGAGLYQNDLTPADGDLKSLSRDRKTATGSSSLFNSAAINLVVERMARHQPLADGFVDRDLDLLHFQFDPKAWMPALQANGLTASKLRCMLAGQARAREWIEANIEKSLPVVAGECKACYDAYPTLFTQPRRLRASHVFLAAPPGSPPELVEEKRAAAQDIFDRLQGGETFADLVVVSEDEASKKRGGDLDFFSESRLPPDFWSALNGWPAEQTSGLIRTKLGFHIVQLTGSRPGRRMPLAEVMAEIRMKLENEKRSAAVRRLAGDLSQHVRWTEAEIRSFGLEIP